MKFTDEMRPYRVGFGSDAYDLQRYVLLREWRYARYVLKRMRRAARSRSWWGTWQAEWTGCGRAVRGLTYQGTALKAARERERRG